MKTVRDVIVKPKQGSPFRRVTVEIPVGETLVSIDPDQHYKLGYPLEDVVPGNIISDAQRTHWCCVEQKWQE